MNSALAHFVEESFEQHRADGWKKLKPNAVPTLFPRKEPARGRKSRKLSTGAAAPSEANDGSTPTEGPAGLVSTEAEVHLLPSSNGDDTSPRRSSRIRTRTRPAKTRRTPRRTTATKVSDAPKAVPLESPCSKSACVESREQLAVMIRRHDELVEAYGVANSTVETLRSRVEELENTVEILRQRLQPRESGDFQPSP
ncbi:hypothetical protein HPB52_018504 [Rhipicephalus sanguineus]|uniref:Uncharacterized protein n=1 Tax=Rhipicephalus sanguineus TaxID=34632 RepID=A0A9D4PDH3_RHISA|nr:hypothetical protein HPB52_018504 [Rhipicephalus sanguineus]